MHFIHCHELSYLNCIPLWNEFFPTWLVYFIRKSSCCLAKLAETLSEWILLVIFHFCTLVFWLGAIFPVISGCGFPSGPIPDGADAVVQVEDTEQIEDPSLGSKRDRIMVKTNKGAVIQVEDTEQIKDPSLGSKGVRIRVKTNKGADIRPVVWYF